MDVARSTYRVQQTCTHHFDMIYLLTAIGLSPGGSSTVQYSTVQYSTHLHTNNTQNFL